MVLFGTKRRDNMSGLYRQYMVLLAICQKHTDFSQWFISNSFSRQRNWGMTENEIPAPKEGIMSSSNSLSPEVPGPSSLFLWVFPGIVPSVRPRLKGGTVGGFDWYSNLHLKASLDEYRAMEGYSLASRFPPLGWLKKLIDVTSFLSQQVNFL